jgi:hypothetical protein
VIDRKAAPPIADRLWREPFNILWAFVNTESIEERDRLRPMVPGACREFRKRTHYLKRNYLQRNMRWSYPDADFNIRDQGLHGGAQRLLDAMSSNGSIDDDSRRRIFRELNRLFTYKGA